LSWAATAFSTLSNSITTTRCATPAPRQLPARLAWRRPPMHPDSKPSDRTRSNTPLPLPSPLAADPRSPALTLADGSDAHKARRAVKARNQYWPTRLGPAWQKHPQCRPSRTRPARRFFLRWPRYDCLAVGLTPEFGHENLSGIHRSSRHSLRDRRCGVFLRRVLQRGRHIRGPRLGVFGARQYPPGLH